MNKFIWPVRVYHEDTDSEGVVYHANYLKFMERTRTELLRHLNIEQTLLKQEYNLIFVASKFTVKYVKPAFFNDLLDVVVEITKLGKVSLIMEHQILRNSEILCTGNIKIGVIDATNYHPQALPIKIIEKMRKSC